MRAVFALLAALLPIVGGAFVAVGTLPPPPDAEGKVALPFFTIGPQAARSLPAAITDANVVAFSDLDESVHRLDVFRVTASCSGSGGGRLELVFRQSPDGAYVVALASAGDGAPTEVTFSRWDGFRHGETLASAAAKAWTGNESFTVEVALDGPRFLVTLDGEQVLFASDPRYERGAVYLRAKRGEFVLADLEARGVGPDGEGYRESGRDEAAFAGAIRRAKLLLAIAAFVFAFAAFCREDPPRLRDLARVVGAALAIGLLPAPLEYFARPSWIVGAYLVSGVAGAMVVVRLAGDAPSRRPASALRWGAALALLSGALAMTTVQRAEQDPVFAAVAQRTASDQRAERAGGDLEPGRCLEIEGPYGNAVVRFDVVLEAGSLLEVRLRAGARRASGVAFVASTDERLGSRFFRQDVTHDEAIGGRAPPFVPGRATTVEISFVGAAYRATIDGRTIEAVDGRHVSGAIGWLVPRGAAKVTNVTVQPVLGDAAGRVGFEILGFGPAAALAILGWVVLRFGARYRAVDAWGISALAILPLFALRGDGVEPIDLVIAASLPACVWILALLRAVNRTGAGRFAALAAAMFVVAPTLAILAAAESRVGKALDHLGRCALDEAQLAILHPKVRQLNDWFAWHEFRGRKASLASDAEVVRILALGSSSTYGFGLSDESGEDWPTRMEAILKQRGRAVEVLNAGVPGAVADTLFPFFEHVLVRYRPDIVTLSLTHNDAYTLTQFDTRRWWVSQIDVAPAARLLRMIALSREQFAGRSKLLRLREAFGTGPDTTTEVWRRLGYREDPPAPVARFEAALRRFAELARRHGIRLVFVQEPLRSDRPFVWKDEFRAVMERLGAEFGLTVAKPQERLRPIPGHERIFVDDVHPTAEGYAIVAEAIADALGPELDRLAAGR